jgi:hypothetical protein
MGEFDHLQQMADFAKHEPRVQREMLKNGGSLHRRACGWQAGLPRLP